MANKSTVTFINTSKEVKKTMVGLSKSALRESGKVVRKYLRAAVPVRSKRFKNHIGSWAMVDYRTGQPQLQIGFYSWQKVKKNGKQPSSASPHWIEFGVKSHNISTRNAKVLAYNDVVYGKSVQHPGTRATNVLRNTVQNNIDEIRKAQEKYLAELNKTLEEAGAKIYTGKDTDEDD